MTPSLKQLVIDRQRALHSGDRAFGVTIDRELKMRYQRRNARFIPTRYNTSNIEILKMVGSVKLILGKKVPLAMQLKSLWMVFLLLVNTLLSC
jgi:hypothetical protein